MEEVEEPPRPVKEKAAWSPRDESLRKFTWSKEEEIVEESVKVEVWKGVREEEEEKVFDLEEKEREEEVEVGDESSGDEKRVELSPLNSSH